MKPAVISADDRRTITRFLRKQGIDIWSNATTDALAEKVSIYYKQDLPPPAERLALLRRFVLGIGPQKKNIVPPRQVQKWRPLKVSNAMKAQLERCLEAHPETLELLTLD